MAFPPLRLMLCPRAVKIQTLETRIARREQEKSILGRLPLAPDVGVP